MKEKVFYVTLFRRMYGHWNLEGATCKVIAYLFFSTSWRPSYLSQIDGKNFDRVLVSKKTFCFSLTQGVFASKSLIHKSKQTKGQHECLKIRKMMDYFATRHLNFEKKPSKITKILQKNIFLFMKNVNTF